MASYQTRIFCTIVQKIARHYVRQVCNLKITIIKYFRIILQNKNVGRIQKVSNNDIIITITPIIWFNTREFSML